MSVPDPRKDPRYRPFRAAAYGVYITVTVAFCLLIIVSVSRSVAAMSPPPLPPAERILTVRECLDNANALWKELEAQREQLVRDTPARKVDQQWMVFRTAWLHKLREREAECALKSRDRDREALNTVYERLERVQNLYTIHAVQYAGEVGGAVDAFHSAYEAARATPSAGKLP